MAVVDWTSLLVTLGSALLGAVLVIAVTHVVVRLLARRWEWAGTLLTAAKVPFRLFVLSATLAGVSVSARPVGLGAQTWDWVQLGCRLLVIVSGAWLLACALLFLEDLGLRRYRTDTADDPTSRRMRTQVLLLRRLTVAAVVVIAVGAALLSFPGVEAVGASILASAGLISVVAALAAQSTLGNLFAGLQLAFSDAIRLDDAVVVEQEWGRVEEITLSYVVVRLWDDRRLVLPSTYFATTPFQNWTRHTYELQGTVDLDVDWSVDVNAMRVELDRLLGQTDRWDGRDRMLQVTDATGGLVRVRALVTAADAGTLWDLRCEVREGLVAWVQTQGGGLPRHRVSKLDG